MTMYETALSELSGVFDKIDDAAVDDAVERIAAAGQIDVYACGRERLQLMGFAMRMFHMGLKVSVVGDVTTPPVGKGDLFLTVVGPGYLATSEALMTIAREAGSQVMMITAQPQGRCARLADSVLHLPAQTMADDQGSGATSLLPMGSLFEGALFVLFEVMVLKLKDRLSIGFEDMRANHTNLE